MAQRINSEQAAVMVPLSALRPAPWNPRTITDPRFAQLCASITADPEFMRLRPILASSDGTIYAGNQRYRAVTHLGQTETWAILSDVPESVAKERALRDNNAWGEWDNDPLARMLAELRDQGSAIENLGFDGDALRKLLLGLGAPSDPGAQVDQAEALQQKWETERGQIWLIDSLQSVGRSHRLGCMDATAAEDVSAVLAGAVPSIMVTDPPYGVNYDPNWRNEAAAKGQLSYAARRIGRVQNDDRVDWSDAWRLFPGNVVYTWSPGGDHVILTGLALQTAGFKIRNQLIWRKPHFPISRGAYTYQHEPCWYAVRDETGADASFCGYMGLSVHREG